MRFLSLMLTPVAVLSASAAAESVAPDPSQDIDCSVLAFYFKGLGDEIDAPADQKQALAKVHDWYAARVKKISNEQGSEAVLGPAKSVLDAVKADPLGMREAHSACTLRAIDEGLR